MSAKNHYIQHKSELAMITRPTVGTWCMRTPHNHFQKPQKLLKFGVAPMSLRKLEEL